MSPATARKVQKAQLGSRAPSSKAAGQRSAPLRVVGPKPRSALLPIALVVCSLIAVVLGHSVLDQGQVRLSTIEGSLTTAKAALVQNELTVATLENPQRIVGTAEGKLHMTTQTPEQVPYVPLNVPLPTPKIAATKP